MKIAVVSSTVLPACLPQDPLHTVYYGSESYHLLTIQGLVERGHSVSFWAPRGGTTLYGNKNIEFHPIIDSKGAHLPDERLEAISYDGSKTTDLLDYDFVLDCSKQNHVTEELFLWNDYNKYVHWKSGFMDFTYPLRIKGRFITHCNAFAENFRKHGHQADVVRFGIDQGFWNFSEDDEYWPYFEKLGLKKYEYWLYPHRPHGYKGFNMLVKLARHFPDEIFIVSTSNVFADHASEIERAKAETRDIRNIIYVDVPKNRRYHYGRRCLVRYAKCLLSLFSYSDNYDDTMGLVSFEALAAGAPVIGTRSPSSQEMLGSLEDKGVTFCDGFESARMAIKNKEYKVRPKVGNDFMPVETNVDDWIRIINKWK